VIRILKTELNSLLYNLLDIDLATFFKYCIPSLQYVLFKMYEHLNVDYSKINLNILKCGLIDRIGQKLHTNEHITLFTVHARNAESATRTGARARKLGDFVFTLYSHYIMITTDTTNTHKFHINCEVRACLQLENFNS